MGFRSWFAGNGWDADAYDADDVADNQIDREASIDDDDDDDSDDDDDDDPPPVADCPGQLPLFAASDVLQVGDVAAGSSDPADFEV